MGLHLGLSWPRPSLSADVGVVAASAAAAVILIEPTVADAAATSTMLWTGLWPWPGLPRYPLAAEVVNVTAVVRGGGGGGGGGEWVGVGVSASSNPGMTPLAPGTVRDATPCRGGIGLATRKRGGYSRCHGISSGAAGNVEMTPDG
jgi:hypothetical protein